MIWININDLPKKPGKYIVETKSNMLGTINRFQTDFNGKRFDVHNQKVLRWLNEKPWENTYLF